MPPGGSPPQCLAAGLSHSYIRAEWRVANGGVLSKHRRQMTVNQFQKHSTNKPIMKHPIHDPARPAMKRRTIRSLTGISTALCAFALSGSVARASIAYGSINN